jgi:DNA-binding response OmpR family regulator
MIGRARILVVDDEAGIRDLLAEVLRGDGYDVEVAETAAAASLRIEAIRFHVAICDW